MGLKNSIVALEIKSMDNYSTGSMNLTPVLPKNVKGNFLILVFLNTINYLYLKIPDLYLEIRNVFCE